MLPQSRPAARLTNSPRYFTGKPCKRGHVAERMTSTGVCVACRRLGTTKWRAEHPERHQQARKAREDRLAEHIKQRAADRYERNKGRLNERRKQRYAANRDLELARNKRWDAENAARRKQWARTYYEANHADYVARTAKRRAAKINATPGWLSVADIEKMEAIYAECRLRGPGWEVDHIVPLQGEEVCGLHVPWNLQIIPMVENRKKSCKLETPSAAA